MRRYDLFSLIMCLIIATILLIPSGCKKPYVGKYLNNNISLEMIGACLELDCQDTTGDKNFAFSTKIEKIHDNEYVVKTIAKPKRKFSFNKIRQGNFYIYFMDGRLIQDRQLLKIDGKNINKSITMKSRFKLNKNFDTFMISYNLKTFE